MTYSIIARNPETGELGIAVQSRFFAAGHIVPWIEAGVGVVASQSFVNPVYGYESLRLMREGMMPQDILEKLLWEDTGEAMRQVAIMDVHGRTALYTGTMCVAAAGHSLGINCCAQANMMVQATVWQAMIDAYEKSTGELAERLLAAMEAAEREGGDLRGRQSASLVVVAGSPSGVSKLDRVVDLRVDDHANPVEEIRRLYNYSQAHHRVGRATDMATAGDAANALVELEACCTAFPDEPEFLYRKALVLLALGRFQEAHAALQRTMAIHSGWGEYLLRFADAGVIPVSREMLQPLITYSS